VAEPFAAPAQDRFVCEATVRLGPLELLTATVAEFEQPLISVTVMVYEPAGIFKILVPD